MDLTKVKEFALSTSKRTKKPVESPKKMHVFKATPKPEFSVPSPKKSTRGFDLAKANIQKKLTKSQNDKNESIFKARDMPNFSVNKSMAKPKLSE